MMFGKKSLGFHCWNEKGEVILVRQERAHHTKDGRQVCVFPQNGDASRSRRGRSVGAALGISAALFVSLFSLLAWLGFEVGHFSSHKAELSYTSHFGTPDRGGSQGGQVT